MSEKTAIGRLLGPASEPLETIAGVLRDHWRSATRLPGELFTAAARPWLRAELSVRAEATHHFASGGRLIR
ncbi:MAG: hypothetical protein JO341_14730 [Gammaproteobacteria bacterium]|nr:hypothetical protein [Gammaproteobacteria bacterium]MBV9622262.1 hypothetical protein [Gammaproteobacteria bacterium]